MTAEAWIAAIVAVATALGAKELLAALVRWVTGKSDRERRVVQELRRERDVEAEYRRKVEEMASATRRVAIECGVDPTHLPEWPSKGALRAAQNPPARDD